MKYVLILATFLLLSCEAENEQPPIEPKKMEMLLMDLHMAEAYSSVARDENRTVTIKNIDSLAAYHREVLKHHDISPERLTEITEWYKDHSEELDSTYSRVLERMSEAEAYYKK